MRVLLLFCLCFAIECSAAVIVATTEANCNGQISTTSCEVRGPEIDGETSFFSIAEAGYHFEVSDDGLSFSATAGAGGRVGVMTNYESRVFSRASSVVQFFLLGDGQARPGFITFSGGGGGDGSNSSASGGFKLFSVDHSCGGPSELCNTSGKLQVQIGIPFILTVEAFGGGNYNPDNGGNGNGSGGTGSVTISLFEADGVTPARVQLREAPSAVPDPATIMTAFLGLATMAFQLRASRHLLRIRCKRMPGSIL
jgi:hypothetical protein